MTRPWTSWCWRPDHPSSHPPGPGPALRPSHPPAPGGGTHPAVQTLCALLEGLRLIGVEPATAWRHVIDCAFASMPQERCRIMDALVAVPGALSRAQVVEAAAGAGDEAVTWELDCLRAYGLVERWSGEGQAFSYTASGEDRETWATFRPPYGGGARVEPEYVQRRRRALSAAPVNGKVEAH